MTPQERAAMLRDIRPDIDPKLALAEAHDLARSIPTAVEVGCAPNFNDVVRLCELVLSLPASAPKPVATGDVRESRLQEIRDRWSKATPGPWRWFGNTKAKDIYLSTIDRGRTFIMQFLRWGTGNAQPSFQVHPFPDKPHWGLMKPAKDMVRYEVQLGSDGKPYRFDFQGLDHPDATALERSWEDVDFLLAEVDRLKAEVVQTRRDSLVDWNKVCTDYAETAGKSYVEENARLRTEVEQLRERLDELAMDKATSERLS